MKRLKKFKQFITEDVDITAQDLKHPVDEPIQQGIPTSQMQVQGQPIQNQPQVQPQMPIQPKKLTLDKYRNMIDYTLLKDNVSKELLQNFIEEAIRQKFYAICILPKYVADAEFIIDDRNLKIVTVIDYPNGTATANEKLVETTEALADGATEIDMVMDFKALKDAYLDENEESQESTYQILQKEIKTVGDECHRNGAILKVIVEAELLTLEELAKACELVTNGGADFIKTSTGTNNKPVELVKVKEMRRLLPDYVKIKISGGVRTLQQCEDFYQYIDRIGTSIILK